MAGGEVEGFGGLEARERDVMVVQVLSGRLWQARVDVLVSVYVVLDEGIFFIC